MRPAEEDKLGEYKNLIAHGVPIDSSHPGFENLTELEKDKVLDFEARGEGNLSLPE